MKHTVNPVVNPIRREHIVQMLLETKENYSKIDSIITNVIDTFVIMNYGVIVKIKRPHTFFIFPGHKIKEERITSELVYEFIDNPCYRYFSLKDGSLLDVKQSHKYTQYYSRYNYYSSIISDFVNLDKEEYINIVREYEYSKVLVSKEHKKKLENIINQILTTNQVFDFTIASEYR